MQLESPRTFLSVDAVASSDGAAGLKLSEQAAASCADSRHRGALPAQEGGTHAELAGGASAGQQTLPAVHDACNIIDKCTAGRFQR